MRRWSGSIFYFSILGLLGLDCLGNINRVSENLGLDSAYFGLVLVLVLLIVRIGRGFVLPVRVLLLNEYLAVVSSFMAIFLLLIERIMGDNFVHASFGLNFQRISIVAFVSLTVALIGAQKEWLLRNFGGLASASAFLMILLFGFIRLWPFGVFDRLVKEDDLVEVMQVLMLILAAVFAFLMGRVLMKKRVNYGRLYLAAVLILLIIAGEEISWGQRLVGVSSPEWLMERNVQKETNVHNLVDFSLTRVVYILVGIYGAFSRMIFERLRKRVPIFEKKPSLGYLVTMSRSTFWHFFLPGLFFFYTAIRIDHGVGYWGEVIELVLYSGIVIFFLERYLRSKKLVPGKGGEKSGFAL